MLPFEPSDASLAVVFASALVSFVEPAASSPVVVGEAVLKKSRDFYRCSPQPSSLGILVEGPLDLLVAGKGGPVFPSWEPPLQPPLCLLRDSHLDNLSNYCTFSCSLS